MTARWRGGGEEGRSPVHLGIHMNDDVTNLQTIMFVDCGRS